jgi:hypothetical protein
MSTTAIATVSTPRPEPTNPTARALIKLLDQYGPAALAAVDDISRALVLADGVKAVREVVKQAAPQILPLQGSSLGFRTDKDSTGGYPEHVVVECATEALLRGLRLTGNEWNIIGGRCYVAQAGCARLVSTYPGLTDLEHAPGVPIMGNGGAIVEYTMRWKLDGVSMAMTRQIPVRVNGGMGMDAVLGKAKRKMLAAVYERISGSVLSEGEPEESLQSARPPRSLVEQYGVEIAAAPTMDALKAVVERVNADIKSGRINKDQNAALASLIAERKKQLTEAAQHTFPLTSDDDDGAEEDAQVEPPVKTMPAAERRTEPPVQAPAPRVSDEHGNYVGGDLMKRIVALLGKPTGIDWTQVRDDKLDAQGKASDTGGIAKVCGFRPDPTLKVPGLAPGAALKLYEILKAVEGEKLNRAAKREANKAAKESAGAA